VANPFVKIRDVIVNDNVAGDQAIRYVLGGPTGDVLVVWQGPGIILQTFDANGRSAGNVKAIEEVDAKYAKA